MACGTKKKEEEKKKERRRERRREREEETFALPACGFGYHALSVKSSKHNDAVKEANVR